MTINILGGALIDSEGLKPFPLKKSPSLSSKMPPLPKGRTIFKKLPSRYGRFDGMTRIGVLCGTRALQSCGRDEPEDFQKMGVVISSRYECYDTDLKFFETTKEEEGAYTSPQMFSYTLPGLASGELAISHKLIGPTFNVSEKGDAPGTPALQQALILLKSGLCNEVLTGFAEFPPEDFEGESYYGSGFLILSISQESSVSYTEEQLLNIDFLSLFNNTRS